MGENNFQLERFKAINKTDSDFTDRIELKSNQKNIIAYDIINSVNVTEQFEIERQNSLKFRIYGGIEYFSLLNNVKINYLGLSDLFEKSFRTTSIRTLENSFDVYLLKPHTTNIDLSSNKYVRLFEVIAGPDDIDIFNAGFSKNIFFEQKHIFTYNTSFELYDQYDSFGKPIVDYYLYFNFKPGTNGNGVIEEISRRDFDGISDAETYNVLPLAYTSYVVGDIIYGDLVEYQKENFLEGELANQCYYVTLEYGETSAEHIVLKYNPFIKIKLRDYDSQIVMQNISGTTVETTIPTYAVEIGNGNYVWQDLMEFGFTDPIDGNGVNFPFVNGSHYVHGNYILSMEPDLTDANTALVFEDINFGNNLLINMTPTLGLDNTGERC